jgi:tetratricopeptide (TPR) repeat protein
MTTRLLLVTTALIAMGIALKARAGEVPAGAEGGEKYALLVGVRDYEGVPGAPRFAESDVLGLAEVLQQSVKIPADHIVLMIQRGEASSRRFPTRDRILEQLDLLASGLREQDTLLVALAGLGVQRAGDDQPWFCPAGARIGDPATWIRLGELQQMMERSRARFKLLMVDASRTDPSLPGPPRDSERPRVPRNLSALAPATARGVLTFLSCSRGERAFEDAAAGHSVFSRVLSDGLRGQADADGDGVGTLGELQTYVFRNVRNIVRDTNAALQQPELTGADTLDRSALLGEILVATKPALVLLKRGKELFENRKYDETITVCTRLLQYSPGSAEAHYLRAKARTMDSPDATAAAIDDFTQAIVLARNYADAYLDRGLLYLEIAELDRAINDFSEAIRLGVSSKEVWFLRGMARLQKPRLPEAAADFTEALRIDPEFAEAHLNRGIACYQLDRLKEALADEDAAIRLNPRLARAYSSRGVVRLALGDLDNAITDFDMAIQQSRRAGDVASMATAYFDRGRAFFLKKDYERAIDDWERVARNFDDCDSMTLDFLGQAYAQLQNELKAMRYYEDAVRLDDNHRYAPAHAHLGAMRYKQKDYVSAIKECSAAIQIDPNYADAYTTRGRAYQALEQPDRARADEKRAEELRRGK